MENQKDKSMENKMETTILAARAWMELARFPKQTTRNLSAPPLE